jgi:hypothetical protein
MLSSGLLTVYASSPMNMGVTSYVIYSVFGFLVLVQLAGRPPASNPQQRNKTQEQQKR